MRPQEGYEIAEVTLLEIRHNSIKVSDPRRSDPHSFFIGRSPLAYETDKRLDEIEDEQLPMNIMIQCAEWLLQKHNLA